MTLTIGELFESLPGRLKPGVVADLKRTVQRNITDPDQGVWTVDIQDGRARLLPPPYIRPEPSLPDFARITLAAG